jgi:serine/threonine protein kinase
VADFGLAKLLPRTLAAPSTRGVQAGTPAYMPPECFAAQRVSVRFPCTARRATSAARRASSQQLLPAARLRSPNQTLPPKQRSTLPARPQDRVDVYAFGVLLWECVAQEPPWRGFSPMQIIFAVGVQGQRPAIPASCPPALSLLMARCWAEEPEARPPFSEVAAILRVEWEAAAAAAASAAAPESAAGGASTATGEAPAAPPPHSPPLPG